MSNNTNEIKDALGGGKVIKEEEKFNYLIPTLAKLYTEINPNQVTLKNNIIYLNSGQEKNDNAYMFMCQDLYREASATHTACINLRTDMTVGNGLQPVVPDLATQSFLDKINRLGDNWQNTWEKICFDYNLHGMFSLQLLYNRNGKIAEVVHNEISSVRAYSPNEDEFIPYVSKWALSNKWAEIRDKARMTAGNSSVQIANFNPSTWAEDGARQLLVHTDYQSGNFPYGLPHYQSVILYIQLDKELAKYHLNKVSGGFFPNVIVQLAGNPDDETKQQFKNQFNRRYKGPDKEKILFIWSEGEDTEPKIIPFNTNDESQVFELLDRIATQKILTAHQVQPELASLPSQGTSLGGDSNKLIAARDNMIRSTIKPIQKSMLQSLNKIFRHNGLQDVTVSNEEVATSTTNTTAETN